MRILNISIFGFDGIMYCSCKECKEIIRIYQESEYDQIQASLGIGWNSSL